MPTLPNDNEFTDSSVTEGQFKTKLNQMTGFLRGLLGTSGNSSDARLALGIQLTPQAYNSRGAWVAGGVYAVNDYVTAAGTTFLCVNAVSGSATDPGSDAAHWQVLQGLTAAALAASTGAAQIGFGAPGSAQTVQQQLDMLYHGVANVWDVQFAGGADTTGATDSAAAIQAALNSKKFINFGSHDYLVASALVPKTGQVLIFSGATIKTASRTQSAFYFNGVNGWSMLGTFNLVGTITGAPAFSDDGGHGIIVRDCYDWLIENPRISWFNGNGLFVTISDPSNQGGPGVSLGRVSQGYFQKNGCGVAMSAGFMAEYVTFSSCFAEYNANAGFQGYAGNVMWTGGSISHNYLNGIELRNGFNSAHGTFSSVAINHNIQAAIVTLDVANGQVFNGCTIFDNNQGPRIGAIFLTGSTGITFNGCELYVDIVSTNAEKDKLNVFNGCVYASGGGAPGRKYYVYSDDASEFTVLHRSCYQAGALGDGVPSAGLSMSDCQMTAAIDQTLTSGTETKVSWNAFISRHGWNMFDGAAKNFKAAIPGVYRVGLYLILNSTTSTLPAGIYCMLKVNGVAKRYQALPAYSTTDAWGSFAITITLAKGDVVDLYVNLPSGAVQLKAESEVSISCG